MECLQIWSLSPSLINVNLRMSLDGNHLGNTKMRLYYNIIVTENEKNLAYSWIGFPNPPLSCTLI